MTGPGGGARSYTRQEWAVVCGPPPEGTGAVDVPGEVAEGEPVTAEEIREIYVPLHQLLQAVMSSTRTVARAIDGRPTDERRPPPFVVGIAGGVAVGKSTTARVLQALFRRGPDQPVVEVLGTDAFLFPQRVLEARGLAARKGFPDTYDLPALLGALAAIRAGTGPVAVPVYSHRAYDVLPDTRRTIDRPDILVVEGLTVLQTASGAHDQPAVSDFLDVALYVDASEEDAAAWFLERLTGLWAAAGDEDGPFPQWLSSLSEDQFRTVAGLAWSEINLVNLREHVAPTRSRAQVVLRKDRHHRVCQVTVRLP